MNKLLSLTKRTSADLLANYKPLSSCEKAQNIMKEAFYSATDYHKFIFFD